MNFFKNLKLSIYSPIFYSKVSANSFKQSIGYFLLLVLVLSAVNLISLINPILFETPKTLQDFTQKLVNCFPKDVDFKITNGQASINSEEPYFVTSCDKGENQKILVIDTKNAFSQNKFNEYNVGIWITKDSIVYQKDKFETRTYSFNQIKDFKLNREVLNSYYNPILPYLKFIGPILMILAFLGIYLSYDFRLIHLLLVAALILVIGKIFKKDLGFGQSYKIGLYAITLGLTVDLVVNLTSRWSHFSGFPFMVTLITLGVVYINLFFPKKST